MTMSASMDDVVDDLAAESAALRSLLVGLDEATWTTVTPSEPWTIADQIGHLAFFDGQATLSATDPDAFAESVDRQVAALHTDIASLHRRDRPSHGPGILAWWDEARAALVAALRGVDAETRLPWYGPPMRAQSAAAARLMETWAHGTDVAEALGTTLPVSDRLFWVADLGVRTFSFSFTNRGVDVPSGRVRVALRGPSGTTRVWNDEQDDSITGPVEEFCLVVAQRRHVDDTHLVVEGAAAQAWMEIAQVFAGPPGPGRPPSGIRTDP